MLELIRYINLEEEQYYENFLNSLEVIHGDKQARITIMSDDPDYDLAYEGFLQGKNHPYEIDSMIWVFRNFQNISYLQEAISYWEAGDSIIEELEQTGQKIHQLIINNEITEAEKEFYIRTLYETDKELSNLVDRFSEEITEAGIYLNSFINRSILITGLTLIFIGALITLTAFRLVQKYHHQRNEAQFKFKNILENSRDVIYLMNKYGTKYEYMSTSVENMLGYSVNEIIMGGPNFILEKIHPDDKKRIEEERSKFSTSDLEKQLEHDTEFRVKTKTGHYIWVNNKRSLLKDEDGKPVGIIGNVRDISAEMEYVDQINQSLKEKETLLIEIHHRVKNNLAIISGLIELQKEGINGHANVSEVLEEIQSRIQSIVLVHQKLYQSETLSEISLKSYIEDLTNYIDGVLNNGKKTIQIDKKLDDVKLNIIHAVPFGILYNELIVNIYKHAFKENTKQCMAKVELQAQNGTISLVVADNGVGLPEGINPKKPETLGLTLIKSLSEQLNGTLELCDEDWTKFRFTFNLPDAKLPSLD